MSTLRERQPEVPERFCAIGMLFANLDLEHALLSSQSWGVDTDVQNALWAPDVSPRALLGEVFTMDPAYIQARREQNMDAHLGRA